MLEQGGYPLALEDGGIPGTDYAAEVVSIGGDVIDIMIGDRVAPVVDLLNVNGHEREAAVHSLGANAPRVLREYAIFEDKALVKLTKQLLWEEVSSKHESWKLV